MNINRSGAINIDPCRHMRSTDNTTGKRLKQVSRRMGAGGDAHLTYGWVHLVSCVSGQSLRSNVCRERGFSLLWLWEQERYNNWPGPLSFAGALTTNVSGAS